MKNNKVWGLVLLLLWGFLLLNLLLIEVLQFGQTIFIVTGGILLALIAGAYGWFFYSYIKNHKKVLELQDKYVETLKPDKPLRFCPTDEELMTKYYESQRATDNSTTQHKSAEESLTTNDEQEELEMN